MEDLFKGKVVLITGGTGFLGKALVKEIVKFNPQSIRIFSRGEFKHYQFKKWFTSQEELSAFDYDDKIRNLIGDVRDYERLKKAMRNVDYVIHAAALKRLDILEYNVDEAIKTNILGTLNVVNACLEANVEKAVFVSSDKACSPINTYGACKFVSERVFVESNYNKGNKKIIFTSVRYGNVLESTGSVIPLFESKIKNEEEIPLTDSRMTRFIITPKQATNLIFDAIRYGAGGEIFVPELPSFRIVDLIAILKEKHQANNKIKLIGLRPGEKIHELMINNSEIPRTFRFKNMYVIVPSISWKPSIEAEYVNRGQRLSEEDMSEYNSKDVIIPKEEVRAIFKDIGLI